MTGFAPDARHPSVPAGITTLKPTDLPMRLEFNGRRYIILATKSGGLVMNGDSKM